MPVNAFAADAWVRGHEVRATAIGFCYHLGSIFGGLVPPVISYFAVEQLMGFATPMLIGTWVGAGSVVIALLISPETKGKVFVSDLMTLKPLRAEGAIEQAATSA